MRALQDRNRALIAGLDSFGKGSVQTVIPLQGGRDGALRLTTARYYTPAGRSIQGAGITPDMEVASRRIDAAEVERIQRLSVREEDLPNALDNNTWSSIAAQPTFRKTSRRKTGTLMTIIVLRRAMEVLRQGTVAERLRARAG